MATQSTMDSLSDDNDHPLQPILLTRSDTVHPLQVIPAGLGSSIQDKRKWDQVVDMTSQDNVCKVPMHVHSNQLPTTNEVDDDSQDSDDPTYASLNGKKPGRKPMADDEQSDDGDDPKVKRKAQNRAAQRAFRERKERYVKDLELKLKHIQETQLMAANHLFQENHYLRSILYRLETENVALKGIHIQHGPLAGKPMQDWVMALQEHQQRFTNDPMASIMPSLQIPSLPATNPTLMPSVPTNVAAPESNPQEQQRVHYTFAISTPATLRSRHEQQQQQQRSIQSSTPPLAPKQQPSPVELIRLYPGEHSTMQSPPVTASPTLSASSDRHSTASTAQTPNDGQSFCDELSEEVCANAFDQLLAEPLFDNTTGGLDLGFPTLDDTTIGFLSGHEIWDRLSQHARFHHYSSDQLLTMVKPMAKCTHLGPVLTEQDIKVVLDKMDQGLV
ncbi:hypothetical protein BC941DRAFT_268232 [Chlamydoabsidia padenii]|nr:hypothetical protein BC941DRAFT_268232 [Chlamydoabsidia padenii]